MGGGCGGEGVELTVVFRARKGHRDFAAAVQVARCQPGHRFGAGADGRDVAVRFDQDSLQAFDDLAALVGRWAQTRFYLNGKLVPRPGLEQLLGCYRAHLAAADRSGYCRGQALHRTGVGAARQLFPCRLIPISEVNHQGWFQFGRLLRDGATFATNKPALRAAVEEALDASLARHCPALAAAEVDAVIDRLPDRIRPGRDPGWGYREGWQEGRFVRIGVEKLTAAAAPVPAAAPTGRSALAPAAVVAEPQGGVEPVAGASTASAIGRVRYADIGGLQSQIRIMRENIEWPLRFPELFERMGVDPHRGILLCGPPGTGKTMLAKALATECAAHFLAVNGPEILSKWRGESEGALRRVFEEARAQAPSVVLLDEIDAIAPDRGRVQHNHEAVLVSQLLTLMDGLADRGRVVVVATTNRPERVDAALRRPGRLDLCLEIGLPDTEAREEILRLQTGRMPLGEDVDIRALAVDTEGMAGAHLGALCREAGMTCMREAIALDASDGFVIAPDVVDALRVCGAHFDAALAVLRQSQEIGAGR